MSESWLVQNVSSSYVAVDSYCVVRGDVQELTRKHGVCHNTRDSLRYVEIEISCQNETSVHLLEYDLWV